MSKIDELQSDLGYVREVVRRSESASSPKLIYLLWAGIVLVGFALVDFVPAAVGVYWAVMGPVGGVLSMWIGWRDSLKVGQGSRQVGVRHALHWAGMIVAIWLMVPLALRGQLAWEALSPRSSPSVVSAL